MRNYKFRQLTERGQKWTQGVFATDAQALRHARTILEGFDEVEVQRADNSVVGNVTASSRAPVWPGVLALAVAAVMLAIALS